MGNIQLNDLASVAQIEEDLEFGLDGSFKPNMFMARQPYTWCVHDSCWVCAAPGARIARLASTVATTTVNKFIRVESDLLQQVQQPNHWL